MKVVVYRKSSEIRVPNDLSSVLRSFLLYINDLSMNVLRLIVNIYAYDGTVYGVPLVIVMIRALEMTSHLN